MLAVVCRPLLPSQLLRHGSSLGRLLANPARKRASHGETALPAAMILG